MSPRPLRWLGVLLILAPAMAQAAAGRVLYTTGAVEVRRAGTAAPAQRGTPLEARDQVAVGPNSRAQLRMGDGALIALQPSSTLQIDDFTVPQQESGFGTSVLSLLKGGLRTITGLIGKRGNDTYRMNTSVATIGVRGTDYRIALCQGDCGATPDGLYLGVSGGSSGGIVVSNGAGELVLTGNEYAWVPGPDAPPQRLLQPPQILETVMKEGEGGGVAGGELAGGPNDDDDCHCGLKENDPGYHDIVVPGRLLAAEGQIAVAHTTSAADVSPIGVGASIDPRPPAGVTPDEELTAFRALTGGGVQTFHTTADTDVVNVGFDPETRLRWGRWTQSAVIGGAPVDLANHDLHWIAGPDTGALFALPITGSATYDLVGNTNPTDNLGHVGFLGAASLFADFTNQTVTNTLSLTINDQTWNATGTASLHSPLPLFGGNYSSVTVGSAQGTGSFAGFFVPGAGGGLPEGAGLTYNLNNGGVTVNGAAAFGAKH